jgi:hypothetical protein
MSTESAKKLLQGHGRVICRKCKKVIVSCRCMECSKNIQKDLCDTCDPSVKKEVKNESK